jgi:hypothetical protein
MPRYQCKNLACDLFEKEITVAKVRIIYDKILDITRPQIEIGCQKCGGALTYIKEEGAITCHLNLFESKTPEQKREIIHKRSVEHFAKTDKGDLANYKKTVNEDLRRRAEGRL